MQHNAPERVVGHITANSPRHALAMARHSPRYEHYDPDRLRVAVAPPKKTQIQAPQRRVPMEPEQMLLKLARVLVVAEEIATVEREYELMRREVNQRVERMHLAIGKHARVLQGRLDRGEKSPNDARYVEDLKRVVEMMDDICSFIRSKTN